jgi:hypothetical protein
MIKYFKKNPRVLESLSFLLMALVFLVFFYVLMSINKSVIVFLSFILMEIIIIIMYFLFKDKYAKKFLLKCLVFPALFIIIMISSFVYFNISEGKGVNLSPAEVYFDVYISDNSTTMDKFHQDLEVANKIWNQYNISLILNNSYFIEGSLNETEKSYLLDTNANESECIYYNEIISSFSNNKNLKVIMINAESPHKGRGCICGCNSIILEGDTELFMDLTGWNLAHEFGHILGLFDLINRYNLMCDEYKSIRPNFLSKSQLESILENKERFH